MNDELANGLSRIVLLPKKALVESFPEIEYMIPGDATQVKFNLAKEGPKSRRRSRGELDVGGALLKVSSIQFRLLVAIGCFQVGGQSSVGFPSSRY